ncbi:MAG: hypothetical protein CVT92_10145 [Bacteroidetes bacterium HGW-Bacteroidetes-1]|jgi:phosphotransferase system HPr-like phosphotransfer protein|nr:MAG: hypothetical protein CVT92_10145 [Bacteroidetes bacterium HGW-Bacteroidetes-1]
MKTLKIKIAAVLLLLLPFVSFSQSNSIDKLYEKYAGKDGFTSINLSAEMFKLASGFAAGNNTDESAKEMGEVINQISGMKILVLNDSLKKLIPEFNNDIQKLVNTKDFAELMSIEDKGSKVKFLTKKAGANSYSEIIMIAKGDNETVVMSFTGNIKPETLGKLSRTMNIKGMENLDKLNHK